MHVLLINALYAPHGVGGAERSVQVLAEALVRAGHRATVVCTGPEAGVAERTVNGVRVYEVGGGNVYWAFQPGRNPAWLKPVWHAIDTYNPAMARTLGDILDAEAPDVVHTNNLIGFSVATFRAARDRGLPLVHTLRDYQLLCPRGRMFREGRNCESRCWDCAAYALPRRRLSSLADVVVGNSRFILDRHLGYGYFAETSHRRVVFNGYEAPSPLPATPLAERRGHDRLRLGFLGTLSPAKGIAYLLEALDSRSYHDRWELLIGGRGEPAWVERLEARHRHDAYRFVGFVEPASFLSEIDVLVVPSLWHDPLPRTIYEAFAHGVPVIGSNRGGIPEVIDEGVTGSVFDPDQPADLHRALDAFIEDPERASAMRPAVLAAARSFHPDRTRGGYLEAYATAIATRPSAAV